MGFFTQGELNKSTKIKVDTDQLQPDCLSCGLNKDCKHPKMPVSGEGAKGILIIGEFPYYDEDADGVSLSGENAHLLRNELKRHDISLNRDCWKINAVNCLVTSPEGPTKKQIKYCNPYVERTIRELKPKAIFAMGKVAIASLFANDFSKNTSVDRWRMYCIPDEKYKCNIIPMFHPSHVVRFDRDKNLHALFRRDVKRAVLLSKREYKERVDYEKRVTVLKDFNKVKKLLNRIIERKARIMFDYEGTGLKPFREGHKIVSIGIAVSATKAFAFPFEWKSFWTDKELREIKRLWKTILLDQKIDKMAHGMKFEDQWSTVLGGGRPKGWYWCTMMAEHILDNRKASLGLKFQTFVKFGVRPYDTHIKPFLDSGKGEFNTIEKAPFNELLIYNGLDCIFAWMLFEEQNRRLSGMKGLAKAFGFFMSGLNTMGTIQLGGIQMNVKYYKQTRTDLRNRINDLKKYLEEGREAQKFRKKYNRNIKITSNKDLGKLFYEVLGKDPIYTDEKKINYKTDKLTLESLNLPFVDKLKDMKRLEKADGTYLGQFAREVYKGEMHPFFDLHIPVSYRSSSSKPNFQNLPKRDAEIKALIRKGIIPSDDSVLCEADFSGAEVITSVCYHKDKNFYNYLTDKSTDMHRDNATDLWLLPNDMLASPSHTPEQTKLAKMIRFFAKNNWTFAQFYGDWFGSCGPLLWENCVESGLLLPNGQTIKDHLETKGIFELGEVDKQGPTPGSFLEHCAHVEDKMWNERFPEYTQWKKDIVEFYQKYGYIETYFGFRFVGYMDWKQCCNFPIQGTSFHLLVYTLIQIDKFIRRNKLRTKLIGQIHDSIISDVHKDELTFYLQGVNKIVKGLQERFPWLIVPMEIEAEISQLKEDGGSFAEMKEVDPDNPIIW